MLAPRQADHCVDHQLRTDPLAKVVPGGQEDIDACCSKSARITREEYPEIYLHDVSAAGPAGTVLAYKTSTYHRGTAMTASGGARFTLKASYRTVSDVWFDKLSLTERLGESWYRFVERASPRQLELVGFPPRGHRYWTPRIWSDVSDRYPNANLSAFRPR